MALAAYRVYRQPADRTLGLQLLDTLVRRYPSSSLVRRGARADAPPCAGAGGRQGLAAKATLEGVAGRRQDRSGGGTVHSPTGPGLRVDAGDDDRDERARRAPR